MSADEGWIREEGKHRAALSLQARTLHREQSPYQSIEVAESEWLGRVLVLDGVFQTSEEDEFYYHEMIVHPALCTAPSVANVLVIGGGDGGSAREVLRHPWVKRCTMVEIDERVVRVCQEHMPELGGSVWNDARLDLRFADGIDFVKSAPPESIDVVILDGSDPIGPAEGLFDRSFYESVARVLTPGGVLSLQSESPTFDEKLFFSIQRLLGEVFGNVAPMFTSIPLYGVGMWTFTLASKSPLSLRPHPQRLAVIEQGCEYYNAEIHSAAFAQPSFVRRRLRGEER